MLCASPLVTFLARRLCIQSRCPDHLRNRVRFIPGCRLDLLMLLNSTVHPLQSFITSRPRNTCSAPPFTSLGKRSSSPSPKQYASFNDEDIVGVTSMTSVQQNLHERNRHASCKAKNTRSKQSIGASSAKTRQDAYGQSGPLLKCLSLPQEHLSDEGITCRPLGKSIDRLSTRNGRRLHENLSGTTTVPLET